MQEINLSAFEISKQVDLPKIVSTNTTNVVNTDFDAINSNFDEVRQSFDSQGQESFAIDTNKSVESFSDFDIPTLGDSENADLANASDDKFLFNKLEINEISFEEQLNTGIDPEEPLITSKDQIDAVKTFDFSEISLELNDDDTQQLGPLTENIDSIEIETKLSLVLAYIEMDDLEGAKEMLDEVMNEGSENQRKRAQEIATKLG